MKIVKLKAKNIKKLKEVEIEPNQNLVLVTGKNRNGKTSLLDSILYALGGAKAIPDKPISKGEKDAYVDLDLGDYKIHRSFTENGTYLKVKNKDGMEFSKSQSILDKMVNKLYFNPLGFMDKQGKEQKEIVLKALGVDLSEENKQYEETYEERKLVGRERKKAKAKLSDMDKPSKEFLNKDKVSVSNLMKEREEISTKLNKAERTNNTITEEQSEIDKLNKEIEELKARIANKYNEIDEIKHSIKQQKEELNNYNTEELRKKKGKIENDIENAEEINNKINEAHKYKEVKQTYEESDEEYKNLSLKLEEIEVNKSLKLRKANLPDKLDVTQNGLSYDDVPLSEISGAEKLIVSLSIAMMLSGDFQVIRITDGSLLDSNSLKIVKEMAEEKDFQIWLEYVKDKNEGIGIYLEDGEVC